MIKSKAGAASMAAECAALRLPLQTADASAAPLLTHGDSVAVGAARVVEGGGSREQAHTAVLGGALGADTLQHSIGNVRLRKVQSVHREPAVAFA